VSRNKISDEGTDIATSGDSLIGGTREDIFPIYSRDMDDNFTVLPTEHEPGVTTFRNPPFRVDPQASLEQRCFNSIKFG
jgi:hypothetical protein